MSRSTVWSLVYMRHVFIAAESYALTEGAGTAQVTMPGKHHPSAIVFFTQLGLDICMLNQIMHGHCQIGLAVSPGRCYFV